LKALNAIVSCSTICNASVTRSEVLPTSSKLPSVGIFVILIIAPVIYTSL
jgi:hypothetical protein